jgi:GNAT superfamily N-acetyltransferase
MVTIIQTHSENEDFKKLVESLDQELAIRDGEDHDFYHQFNSSSSLKEYFVAYLNEMPVGCVATKIFSKDIIEVKRMFVPLEFRGNGIASKMLSELELLSKKQGFSACILETGINQPEAIALYKKMNYQIIGNYGQYENVSTSICFEKKI